MRSIALKLSILVAACAAVFASIDRSSSNAQSSLNRGALRRKSAARAPAQEGEAREKENSPAHEEFLKINFSFNRGLYSIVIPRYEKLLKDHPQFESRAMVHYALALCHSHIAARQLAAGSAAAKSQAHHEKTVRALRSALADKKFPAGQRIEGHDTSRSIAARPRRPRRRREGVPLDLRAS
jgi:hypothetical protein